MCVSVCGAVYRTQKQGRDSRGEEEKTFQQIRLEGLMKTRAKEREAIFPVTWLSWDHPDAPVPGLSTCRSWQREAQPLKIQLLTCHHCVLSVGPRVAAQ